MAVRPRFKPQYTPRQFMSRTERLRNTGLRMFVFGDQSPNAAIVASKPASIGIEAGAPKFTPGPCYLCAGPDRWLHTMPIPGELPDTRSLTQAIGWAKVLDRRAAYSWRRVCANCLRQAAKDGAVKSVDANCQLVLIMET